MRIIICRKLISLWMGLSILPVSVVFCAPIDSIKTAPNAGENRVVWGIETNGCRAGISVQNQMGVPVVIMHHSGAVQDWSFPTVSVYFKLSSETDTNVLINSTNIFQDKKPLYFWATNMFYGPIELRDPDGRKMDLLQPELNATKAYPDVYSLKAIAIHFSKFLYSGPRLPPIPLRNGQQPAFFREDYFKLEKPGEYKLTVWPKIYKRISPTNDICQRIDIPPVTIPIEWKGDSTN